MFHLLSAYHWTSILGNFFFVLWAACNIGRIFAAKFNMPRLEKAFTKGLYTGVVGSSLMGFIFNPATFTKYVSIIFLIFGVLYLLAKYFKYKEMKSRQFFLVTTKYISTREGGRTFYGTEKMRRGAENFTYGDEEITFYGEVRTTGYSQTLWRFVTENGSTNYEISSEFNGVSFTWIWDDLIVSQIPMRWSFWKGKLVFTYAN